MHGHQNCTSPCGPHMYLSATCECEIYTISCTQSRRLPRTIAKLPEKALKITLICDFNRVVLHQYCMYGFRDLESGL
jgi:hypothetical protein